MRLKARIDAVESALAEAELDRCAHFLSDQYRLPLAEARQQIKAKALELRAQGVRLDTPEHRRQIDRFHREIDHWERKRQPCPT
jgi:hypothetical protein